MLAYSISQTHLDHLADKVRNHMWRFAEIRSGRYCRVEFKDIAESYILPFLLKPIIAIDFRVHAQCFWDHTSHHCHGDCLWHWFRELSQDKRACIVRLIRMALRKED